MPTVSLSITICSPELEEVVRTINQPDCSDGCGIAVVGPVTEDELTTLVRNLYWKAKRNGLLEGTTDGLRLVAGWVGKY